MAENIKNNNNDNNNKKFKYKLVIFDLDGTLTNTLQVINKTTNVAMEKLGLKTYKLEETPLLIGLGIKGIVDRVIEFGNDKSQFGEHKGEIITKNQIENAVREAYQVYYNYNITLYDGIDKLLDFLEENDIKMAIITNKDHNLAIKTVNEFLDKWNFITVLGNDESKYPRKPDPYNVNVLAEKFNIDKNEILFVGDMMVDVNTAKNAGVDIVYCEWGFGALKGNEVVSEDVKVSTAYELIDKIKK